MKSSTECPKFDLHVHTKYLGCANETMEIPDIVRRCEELGVTKLGITDHLNSLDRLELHRPIRADLEKIESDIEIYFGVELNFTGCDEGFVFSEEIRDEMGFQFAIGGIHGLYLEEYDLGKLVDIQHRHHLATCRDPLVAVVVHPYWFSRSSFRNGEWPWFDSMKAVPESYARELGQVAKETGTAVEINADANLVNPDYSETYVEEYFEFMSIVAEEGCMFSVGSDAHRLDGLNPVGESWKFVERLGIDPDRIWRPACKPFAGNGSRA